MTILRALDQVRSHVPRGLHAPSPNLPTVFLRPKVSDRSSSSLPPSLLSRCEGVPLLRRIAL
eukprot:6622200-Pyramimonas_sp.AAC.1